MTREEFVELGELQALAVRLLHEELDCAKEYMACFAEAEHFQHLHVHVVAKPRDLPDEFKGTKIFAIINVTDAEALPPNDIKAFCEELRSCTTWK